jgi:hypothetical protein
MRPGELAALADDLPALSAIFLVEDQRFLGLWELGIIQLKKFLEQSCFGTK